MMRARSGTWRKAAAFAVLLSLFPCPAPAYLYWSRPDFSGPPVHGDEPGITLPLVGATPTEVRASLVWTLRAALNVAALQCQFSAPLMTVRNYNSLLSQHGKELAQAYATVGGYFKRTVGKKWQISFDEYTTRTYNGISTMHAQIGFCETAGKVGRIALAQPRGQFYIVAEQTMREIRNSLVPAGDRMLAMRPTLSASAIIPPLEDRCWDRKDQIKKKCWPLTQAQQLM